jgi:uncharacterized surface protein with fasciclin (FAS1) repeats
VEDAAGQFPSRIRHRNYSLQTGRFNDAALTFGHRDVTGNLKRPRLSPARFSVKRHERKNPLIRPTASPVDQTNATHGIRKNYEEILMLRTSMAFAAAALIAGSAYAGSMKKDIVDTAVNAGSFETLVAAVQAAGLVETLKGDGPFTVFAPTDEAFAALPEGTVEELLKPENKDQLTAILTYHVVPGKVMSGDLSDDMMATTVQGTDVMIDLDNGVMVQDATVVSADIETSNGVIHVIDKVILPEG